VQWRFSVVLELSHPLRPVLLCDSSGYCPRAAKVKAFVPYEVPQLLKPHLPDRKIPKKHVYITIVPVDADAFHRVAYLPTIRIYVAVKFRRFVSSCWLSVEPPAIEKQRYLISAFDIGTSPVIFSRMAPEHFKEAIRLQNEPSSKLRDNTNIIEY